MGHTYIGSSTMLVWVRRRTLITRSGRTPAKTRRIKTTSGTRTQNALPKNTTVLASFNPRRSDVAEVASEWGTEGRRSHERTEEDGKSHSQKFRIGKKSVRRRKEKWDVWRVVFAGSRHRKHLCISALNSWLWLISSTLWTPCSYLLDIWEAHSVAAINCR